VQNINSWVAIADACSKTKTLAKLTIKDCSTKDGEVCSPPHPSSPLPCRPSITEGRRVLSKVSITNRRDRVPSAQQGRPGVQGLSMHWEQAWATIA
jgi:hypothetical protein